MKLSAVLVLSLSAAGYVSAAPPASVQGGISNNSENEVPEYLQQYLQAHMLAHPRAAEEPTSSTTTSAEATSSTTTKPKPTTTTTKPPAPTKTSTSTTAAKTTTTSTAKPTSTSDKATEEPGQPCEKWEDYEPDNPKSCKLTSDQVKQFFAEMNAGGGNFDVSAADSGSDSGAGLDPSMMQGAGGTIIGVGDR